MAEPSMGKSLPQARTPHENVRRGPGSPRMGFNLVFWHEKTATQQRRSRSFLEASEEINQTLLHWMAKMIFPSGCLPPPTIMMPLFSIP